MSNYSKEVFSFKKKKLRSYFQKQFNPFNSWNYLKDKHEIHFSNHFLERVIERNLESETFTISQIIDYFYVNFFLPSTYTERCYLIQLGILRIAIQISYSNTKQLRILTVKTIFNSDESYEFDELIELSTTIKYKEN
jgi:hypothetical protein